MKKKYDYKTKIKGWVLCNIISFFILSVWNKNMYKNEKTLNKELNIREFMNLCALSKHKQCGVWSKGTETQKWIV